MKIFRISAALLLALLVAGTAYADTARALRISNRLRFEYDNNVFQTDGDEKDSFNVYEAIEVALNLNLENTYLGISYRPSFVWYSGRDSGSTDFLNDLDANFSQKFGPVVTLGVSEKLRAGQLPAVEDDDYQVRSDDDNVYNSILATLAIQMLPATRLDLSGRHVLLKYGEDAHDNDNYRILVAGATLRQVFGSLTTGFVDGRYSDTSYFDAEEKFNRDSKTIYAGLGLEQTFNPKLLGTLRAGFSRREFDLSDYDDSNNPYADLSISFLPSPATRLTANLGYSIAESSAGNYLSENRLDTSLHFAHDFTAKITLNASVGYAHSEYDAKYQLVKAEDGSSSDEDSDRYYATALLAYQVVRNNWLELGWQFVKLDSDVETSYDRNRINLGWRIQLF